MSNQMVEIHAEIFRDGGHGYTPEDLRRFADAYNSGTHEAPVTANGALEGPALGWLRRGTVRAVGDCLYGTLEVVSEFGDTIKNRIFKKRSIELYRDGSGIRRLGFDGVTLPTIPALEALGVAFDDNPERETVIVFNDIELPPAEHVRLADFLQREAISGWGPLSIDNAAKKLKAEWPDIAREFGLRPPVRGGEIPGNEVWPDAVDAALLIAADNLQEDHPTLAEKLRSEYDTRTRLYDALRNGPHPLDVEAAARNAERFSELEAAQGENERRLNELQAARAYRRIADNDPRKAELLGLE